MNGRACAHLFCAHVCAYVLRALHCYWHIRFQDYVWILIRSVHLLLSVFINCHERTSMRAPGLRPSLRARLARMSARTCCAHSVGTDTSGYKVMLQVIKGPASVARIALLAPHQVGRFCLSRFFLLYFFVNLFSLVAKRGQHARTFFARAHQVTRLFWTMFLYLYPYKCMCSQ